MKIAILGAESTGKSELAKQLEQHFLAQGKSVQHIPEYLRTWCNAENRTPRKEEQLAIATEQVRQINKASACDVLISDTAAVTVAVYSDLLFNDTSLYDMAISHQRTFHTTLLMGLDVAWVADGIQRDGSHTREPVDTALRQALSNAGIAFQVVYGTGASRLENALRCLGQGKNQEQIQENSDGSFPSFPRRRESTSANMDSRLRGNDNRGYNWQCERCSDPVCEHRLFRDLLQQP